MYKLWKQNYKTPTYFSKEKFKALKEPILKIFNKLSTVQLLK